MPIKVIWGDVDPAQHVNNAQYFAYMEEAGTTAAAKYNFVLEEYLEKSMGIVARKTRIEYKQPAVLGDKLEITTYLSNSRPIRGTRHFIFHRQSDQALIAQAHLDWVFIDISTGRPMRMPDSAIQGFAPHIARE